MGGIDKFINSAEKKGLITIIKTNNKKGTIKKSNEWKSITIDTEYFLKTGIKRELNLNIIQKNKDGFDRKKWAAEYYQKNKDKLKLKSKYKKRPPEFEEHKRIRLDYIKNRNKLYTLRNYYKHIELKKEKRRLNYYKNKEKNRQKYLDNIEYYREKGRLNYKIKKIKIKNKEYYTKNILPYIINASFKE
jgi:flagellar hook protein FlgE